MKTIAVPAAASLTLALLASGPLTPARAAAGQVPAPRGAAAQAAVTPVPAQGSAAAVALGDATVIAWLAGNARGEQVLATAGDAGIRRLGPDGRGSDAPPVAAATSDGSVMVVSSRRYGAEERLWTQLWTAGGWEQAAAGPSGAARNRHPALATTPAPARAWLAWIGEQPGDPTSRTLFASRWDGSAWAPAEPLPRSVGAPMPPAIAIDGAGNPVVVWAAGDGGDAEIWLSRRVAGRWSAPMALTHNDVPDIMPSLAATGDGLLVTWISYTGGGYLPRARVAAGDRWEPAVSLDDEPGSHPVAALLDGAPVALWRKMGDGPGGGGAIVARRRLGSGWGPAADLVEASGSPFSLGRSGDGRVALVWTRADGALDRIEARGAARGGALRALSEAAARARSARSVAAAGVVPDAEVGDPDAGRIPSIYSAFGDSITNGVVYDPERRTSEGYRAPLETLLRDFFGIGAVLNAGVDGEGTADGVGRIDNVVRDQDPDVVLIMEGTNDVFGGIDEGTIAFNLRRIAERASEEKPSILRFLATVPPRFDPAFGFEGSFNESADILNTLLGPIAADLGIPLVDENSPLRDKPELWSNPLHPSIAGYEVMGEAWFGSVKPVALDASNHGDMDGSGRTDGLDLVRLALAFGALAGEARYDPIADINGDGIVDGFDLNLLAEFFGSVRDGG